MTDITKTKTFSLTKNIFILLLPFITYSTTYLIPDLNNTQSEEYKEMHQSKLTLPIWVLFMIWCLIYIGMGASMVKVINQKKYFILTLYIIQIITNYVRAISVYKLHNPNIAFIMSIIFLIAVIINNIVFFKRSKKSGIAFFVYTTWAIYIFYLQLSMKFKLY
ncbi:TspO/MBR family [seawater metagenome]|uniref:TspO/MBR family n=1 Tax=seawater metagenome TaxID=1561972 RepID=A0A5E8CKI1_9ZZZZ